MRAPRWQAVRAPRWQAVPPPRCPLEAAEQLFERPDRRAHRLNDDTSARHLAGTIFTRRHALDTAPLEGVVGSQALPVRGDLERRSDREAAAPLVGRVLPGERQRRTGRAGRLPHAQADAVLSLHEVAVRREGATNFDWLRGPDSVRSHVPTIG